MTQADRSLPTHVDENLYVTDFAEMMREMMRALVVGENTEMLMRSSERFERLIGSHNCLPPDLNWRAILAKAVASLKPPAPDSQDYQQDHDKLARLGLKLFLELTTSDELSTARINKARKAIAEEIDDIPKWRKLRKELRESN